MSVDEAALLATAQQLLDTVDASDATLSITLVRDRAMRAINREHREKDTPTDVLSFPLLEPEAFVRRARTRPRERGTREHATELMLGDIVISLDTAQRQAAAYDATLDREMQRLLIHGVLHLCGHDHMQAGERRTMEREERRLAAAIGMPWPYRDDV